MSAAAAWLVFGGAASGAVLLRPFAADTPVISVTVSIDGLATRVAAPTAASALERLGLVGGAAEDALVRGDAGLVAGERIAIDRGLPVTLVQAGHAVALRSRGTVADFLARQDLALGPLDVVEPPLDTWLTPGTVVQVTRIAVRDATLRESMPFGVRTIPDASLDRGRTLVESPGRTGEVINSYRIRRVDGVDTERTLLTSVVLTAPVEEVRRVGTRPPVPPSDIEEIIRAAAAAQGADADQLLGVAWCESRYNPNAVNPSGAAGLFQFMPGTWAANSVRAGYAGASVFDPVANANVAAWMFARGSASQWQCK